jgi:hypothetical protein
MEKEQAPIYESAEMIANAAPSPSKQIQDLPGTPLSGYTQGTII